MTSFRFAVNVTPKPGILDPQGRAVEGSLGHLGIEGVSGVRIGHLGIGGVSDVRIGRRAELTVDAPDEATARAGVERLAAELDEMCRRLLANTVVEDYAVELLPEGNAA